MTHIAMHLADKAGSTVTWGEHVTDDEYGEAPVETLGSPADRQPSPRQS
jgi:hypothetical protein